MARGRPRADRGSGAVDPAIGTRSRKPFSALHFEAAEREVKDVNDQNDADRGEAAFWERELPRLTSRLRATALGVALGLLGVDLVFLLAWLAPGGERPMLIEAVFHTVQVVLPLTLIVCLLTMRWLDRELVRMLGVTRNALDTQREQRHRVESILTSAMDCILLADARDGRLLEFNPAAERTFGYTREAILGEPIESVVFPQRLQATQRAALLEGATQPGGVGGWGQRIETTAARVDGTEFPAEMTVTAARRDHNDPVRGGLTVYLRDITAEKEAERALRESEARHRALLEAIPDLMLRFDGRGGLLDVRAGTGTESGDPYPGLTTTALESGMALRDVLPEDVARALRDCAERARRDKASQAHEYELHGGAEEESPRFFEARVTHVEGEGQSVALVRDVTQRRRAEAALREAKEAAESASRAKTEFLASMSHEVRTPMTAIVGYADLLVRSGPSAEQASEWMENIRRNANYLLELVSGALDLSKIEAGQLDVETETASVVNIIDDVRRLMAPRAEEKGIAFKVQYDARVPETIETDPLRLRQILVNLTSNAIKFTDEGSVTLRVRTESGTTTGRTMLRMIVRDTGIGISDDKLHRLFNPFEQVHTNQYRQAHGSGLGLSIAKRLAQLLDGDVTAASAPGQGSTFTVSLDIGPAESLTFVDPERIDPGAPDLADSRSGAGSRADGARVLLVDDNPHNRDITRYLLEEAGASVSAREDGQAAVDTVLADPDAHDVILMDMQMPVRDGYSATRLLREHGVRTPIVALTAYAMSGDADRCHKAGCDGYLSKPLVPETLIETVARWAGIEPAAAEREAGAASSAATSSELENGSDPRQGAGGMAELRRQYVAWLAEARGEVAEAHAAGDADRLERITHQLKGSGGMYGYPQISSSAKRCLELVRQQGVTQELAEPVAELLAALDAAAQEPTGEKT